VLQHSTGPNVRWSLKTVVGSVGPPFPHTIVVRPKSKSQRIIINEYPRSGCKVRLKNRFAWLSLYELYDKRSRIKRLLADKGSYRLSYEVRVKVLFSFLPLTLSPRGVPEDGCVTL
jgi:hypothetical protein